MKITALFVAILAIPFGMNAQIESKRGETKTDDPCYVRAERIRKEAKGWQCGKMPNVIDCAEELEFSEDSKIFTKKASGTADLSGVGKPFTGACESCFYSNGGLERRIYFVDGREHGQDTTYYENGCIQVIRSHMQGAEHGTFTFYYDSTQNIAWEMNFQLGEKHGKHVYMRNNGDTTKLEHYKAGKLDGLKKDYYKGNLLYKEVYYKDGVLHGKFKVYNKEGVLLEDGNYNMNKKHGSQKMYYDDGTLLRTESYENGVKHGEFKMFYYQGFVQTVEQYNKGIKTGKWEEFYHDQRLKRVQVFDNKGNLIEEHQFDDHGNETYTFGGKTMSEREDDELMKSESKKGKKKK